MSQTVIILGAARSGTKYLRDVLATAPNAACVPYDINYIWRFGSEGHLNDALPASLVTDSKARFIRAQVHRLAAIDPSAPTVVFEKTVGSTLRVPFVDAVFPEAKFIHLVRDGRAVTESAMRQWQEPMNWRRLFEKARGLPLQNLGYAGWFATNFAKGLFSGRGGGRVWGPRYPGIDEDVARGRDLAEICAEQWRASVAAAREGLRAIPVERQITIRYDALVGGTDALGNVAEFCGLENVDDVLQAHRARVIAKADDKWRTALSAGQKAKVEAIVAPLQRELGYIGGIAA
jgi:hypothetical protein